MTDIGNFGAWLASLRAENGKRSLRLVAASVGCTASHLSDVEHRRRDVSIELAVRICKYFDYDPFSVIEWFEILPADIVEYLIAAAERRGSGNQPG